MKGYGSGTDFTPQALRTTQMAGGYSVTVDQAWPSANDMSAEEALAHEGAHMVNGQLYDTHGDPTLAMWNENLPRQDASGSYTAQGTSHQVQSEALASNLKTLQGESDRDLKMERINPQLHKDIKERLGYAVKQGTFIEYNTVLNELSKRMQRKMGPGGPEGTRTYQYMQTLRREARATRDSGGEHSRHAAKGKDPLHKLSDSVKKVGRSQG